MNFHPVQSQQPPFVSQNDSIKFSPEGNLLVPFTLSWAIQTHLNEIVEFVEDRGMKLRFLLVLSEQDEALLECVEMRYALLWNLHNQLQGLKVPFFIETAVGPLLETAVSYAKQYQNCQIYTTDVHHLKNFAFSSKTSSYSG